MSVARHGRQSSAGNNQLRPRRLFSGTSSRWDNFLPLLLSWDFIMVKKRVRIQTNGKSRNNILFALNKNAMMGGLKSWFSFFKTQPIRNTVRQIMDGRSCWKRDFASLLRDEIVLRCRFGYHWWLASAPPSCCFLSCFCYFALLLLFAWCWFLLSWLYRNHYAHDRKKARNIGI